MPVATARRDGLTNRQRPQMTDAPGTFGARVLRLFDLPVRTRDALLARR